MHLNKNEQNVHETLEILTKYFDGLLSAPNPPEIPAQYAENKCLSDLHEKANVLRQTIAAFSRGDLSTQISARGFMAGCCKSLQAHLRHLTWQVKQIESEDYSQRVEFLGEFSEAFNYMVEQLKVTMAELKKKEDSLIQLNKSLKKEIEQRNKAVKALQESEEKFKRLAQHDPLTGVFNRRSFFSLAEMEVKSSLAREKPCCLCILDVDHFKDFNDTYGHLAGDEALKHIVEVSKTVMRQSDLIGRYGGEEFVFLFPGSDIVSGETTAERIRLAISQTPLLVEHNTHAYLTASLGVSVILPEWLQFYNDQSINQFLAQADEALYTSKSKGRNMVSVALPKMPTFNPS